MSIFEYSGQCLRKLMLLCCPPLHAAVFSKYHEKRVLKATLGFVCGFTLGIIYYNCLLKCIPFPFHLGIGLGLIISLLWGAGNAFCIQIRCITLLLLPIYCGKPGRGVLKAVVLTYIIAGPITNMGLNAREVVRVFACSTRLSYNLSRIKYQLLANPLQKSFVTLREELGEIENVIRSFEQVEIPLKNEIEGSNELQHSRELSDYADDLLGTAHRSDSIENKFTPDRQEKEENIFQKSYLKKIEYRCHDQLSRSIVICKNEFEAVHSKCYNTLQREVAEVVCSPLRHQHACRIVDLFNGGEKCNSKKQVDPGIGEGYLYIKKAKNTLNNDYKELKLQYKIARVLELHDVQDAKETGERVKHEFREKTILMRYILTVINIALALLFIRLTCAAQTYHDEYLTSIEHDNIYITDYFRKIDRRRRTKRDYTLLPLKKMERSKYVDVHSTTNILSVRHKLVTQILKLMLEVVTATTFVMLDRLFYEALDVVRQHAEVQFNPRETHDLDIKVEGTGMVANVLRKVINALESNNRSYHKVTNRLCLPQPSSMSPVYFVKIYGGYVWILLLLFINGYTLRLKRLICSYFYPTREKKRILHLYNDILKKRMAMHKTVRRKAVQAVRAHYLSGENLLSIRMKFPVLLSWLIIFPAAKMKCLICGETEPKNRSSKNSISPWHSCKRAKCPFIYCPECWLEVGERCVACDPGLAEMSDIESLSEDEKKR